jgi:L-2-hydroxyglutarate oxidase LhgO
LKARLCVRGREQLYAYCAMRGIEHRRCGKLIVATSDLQRAQLDRIAAGAKANGVDDLQLLSRDQARALEPALECAAALLSPSTGIVDSHALMLSLLGDAERNGAVLALNSAVLDGEIVDGGIILKVGSVSGESMRIHAGAVVNCAGLGAQGIARRLHGLLPEFVPPLHYAKGNYYALAGRAPFSRLIYPVPEAAGLGVHLTLDLGGQARFGPDVEWIDHIDYSVAAERADAFYAEVRRYWPQLADGALLPAYAGIRPKPHAPGEPAMDFLVSGPAAHGVPGLVCLYGIESPGLTASLALADHAVGTAVGAR